MIPWAILQRIRRTWFCSSCVATACRRADTIDWLLRWRQTILGWANACAEAAPIADVYHGHDLTALPAALAAARRNGAPVVYDSHEIFLEAGSTAHRPRWARWIFRRLEQGWIRADGGARDGQPVPRGGPDGALPPAPDRGAPQHAVALDGAVAAAAT